MSLRLRAPAKVNWSLEVLDRHPDGYHEVRTILQTIALSDRVTLTLAEELSLTLSGEAGRLADEPPETNLAYRAAERLRRELDGTQQERTGRPSGVHIALEKRIPVAAGLGGGASDAAAVLRGLRALWDVAIPDDQLATLAAELGADVPFFLRGGGAIASGRGDVLTLLPDGPAQRLVLAWPERTSPADKTARMYAALRPQHYTDGAWTERLAGRLREDDAIADGDLFNVFERVLQAVDPAAAEALHAAQPLGFGRPLLAGSGPSFFFLLKPEQGASSLLRALERLGLRAIETDTLAAAEAVACREQA